jgi:hypothetical protein
MVDHFEENGGRFSLTGEFCDIRNRGSELTERRAAITSLVKEMNEADSTFFERS